MAYFDSIDQRVNFPDLEREVAKYWEKNKIVEKYLSRNNTSEKIFSFLDGPITANNPMGVHHAWGRTYKDVFQRFKNMQGFKQRFQNGFDCQGLWVEVEVEKELGLKSKKDIEELVPGDKKKSIAKFIELCRERVYKYADIQTDQSKRLGYFMDWDHSYFTLSEENNYMIWYFLKKAHEKGLIYKGRDSVAWCPRCGTAISQHEMLTEDYKEITHKSIYFELPLVENEGESLIVWTTTPWTLPANIAVAVDKKLDYALVEGDNGDKFWLAKDTIKDVFGEDKKPLKTVKGSELVGLHYKHAFDGLDRVEKARKENEKLFHSIIATDDLILPISTEEGTGMVHIATGAGTEDFALGKKLGLPVIEVIDEEANYLDGLGEFSGKNAKKHPEIIFEYMDPDWVFEIRNYKHRYPACWRCKTELVWRVVDEWYISIDPVREDMKNVTKKIKWIPKFGLKRELDWLNNMHDWLISKKRYWGLAIPIWECKDCGSFEVIGDRDELKERAVEGWDEFEGHTPHRPWVDGVKIACSKCGKPISRIPDVGNPWLDAGIVPYSTMFYQTDKKKWEEWFPADFITESFPGQFKNWFYSMIAMSTVLENREPYKTCFGFATLLAEDGRPMHKSWGNAIEFNEGADKIGVDVMRFMYVRQNPADNMLFGYRVADETRRQFHIKLWNVYNFFVTFSNLNDWDPNKSSVESKHVLDKWILSRLDEITDKITKSLEKFDSFTASGELKDFVDDLSNWYIRRSRDRMNDDFFATTYEVLVTLTKLMAPFMPYLSDKIFTNLTKSTSVHLEDWPNAGKHYDKKLNEDIKNIRLAVENAHAERKMLGIPVRQPLLSLTTTAAFILTNDNLNFLVEDELNVKKWTLKKGEKLGSKFDTTITPELEEEAKTRELIRKIQQERKNMNINLTQMVVVENDWLPASKEFVRNIKDRALVKDIRKGEFKVKPADK